MVRAPRYPSTGDSIHADPLATIIPSGRTFSLYSSETVQMYGVVSSAKNGLLFYDNDREVFLHRPVFTDLLTNCQTPLQIGVVNEFKRITAWKELRNFFLKIDKILILDQFRQYLADSSSPQGHEVFLARAEAFCKRESIRLGREELDSPEALRRLEMAVTGIERLKSSFFVEAIPDILNEFPDTALCRASEQRRAERWLKVAMAEKAIPDDISKRISVLDKRSALKEIVDKYMSSVEDWEGSPLCKLNGSSQSRVDLEDLLTSAATSYCPSPLGWTPRLRYAFYAPESFRNEEVDVQIEVIAALEKRIRREIGIQVKLLYIPDDNCIVLESLGGETGGSQIPCTFENGQQCELEILNSSSENLQSLASAVTSARERMSPENMQVEIQSAREAVAEMREEIAQSQTFHHLEDDGLIPEENDHDLVPAQ